MKRLFHQTTLFLQFYRTFSRHEGRLKAASLSLRYVWMLTRK